ncbi:DEAD/DEAH box helicase [Corynebacterium sp. TAE3-ERU12]|uniref:DEAD/DEAH box helicase n=1 Tax=Corynebacterium sp. TAE3-ERU12 TaxID=2849491 RepID=UPI001C47D3D5|nr:DEAD/DEAH box helicase [Corynebacterium sp. TAE3-ERU12]MBV7295086.1 DEAD/DEAH box helicase [Corynebacterium sp. TAE3-ERU12]
MSDHHDEAQAPAEDHTSPGETGVPASSGRYLVHGLWVPGRGLGVWLEDTTTRQALPDASALDAGDTGVPQAQTQLIHYLQRRSWSRSLELTIEYAGKKRGQVMLPATFIGPLNVPDFFEHLDAKTTTVQLAPDLRYYRYVGASLSRFVRAGRITITMVSSDGEWVPQWRLVEDQQSADWEQYALRMTPRVLWVNGGAPSFTDFRNELTHTLANRDIVTAIEAGATIGRSSTAEPGTANLHRFAHSLVYGTPLKTTTPGLISALAAWRRSISDGALQLVMQLQEPDDLDENELSTTADDPADTDTEDEPRWPLRVMLRRGDGTVHDVDPDLLTDTVRRDLAPLMVAAGNAFPPLQTAPAGQFGLDKLLTTAEVIGLLDHGIAVLRKAGIDVMVPRSWDAAKTTLTASVRSPVPTGAVARPDGSPVGLERIVEYQWRLSLDGQEISDEEMRTLIDAKTSLVRLRNRWVFANSGAVARAIRFINKQTEPGQDPGVGSATLGAFHGWEPHAGDDLDGVDTDIHGEGDLAEIFTGVVTPTPTPLPLPDGLLAYLRDYQRTGFEWLDWMSREGFGAILADDMGLGKTLQVLTLLQHEKEIGISQPSLVIVPTSVVENWRREAERFTPELTVLVQHGPRRATGDDFAAQAAEADIVLTTHALAVRDAEQLYQVDWDHVIVDEAQAIKNPNTRVHRVCRGMPGRHRIALTGTPVENNLGELHAIMNFCNEGILGSTVEFRKKFMYPIEHSKDDAVAARLHAIIDPFILRRTKKQPGILDNLPSKTVHKEIVPLTDEQAALYTAYVDQMQQRLAELEGPARFVEVLKSLTALKQICNHPAHYLADGSAVETGSAPRSYKIERLTQLLDEFISDGERTLVFTQYAAFGHVLRDFLEQRYGIHIDYLHGQVSRAQRQIMMDRFQSTFGSPVMVLSLRAGGVGVNLTAANHVIHYDRWWNPAVENQATDRAYRIGQTKAVTVHNLVCKGTVEERIDALIESKLEVTESVMDGDLPELTQLSDDELHDLVRLRVGRRNPNPGQEPS